MWKIFHGHLEKSKHVTRENCYRPQYHHRDRIFVLLHSIEIEAPRAIISVRDCGKEKKQKKRQERKRGRKWELDQEIARGNLCLSAFFLRRAILLCLNEVGDLTLPRDSPHPRPSYIAGNFVPSVLRSFNSAAKISSLLRRCAQYRSAVRFYLLYTSRFYKTCQINFLEQVITRCRYSAPSHENE